MSTAFPLCSYHILVFGTLDKLIHKDVYKKTAYLHP